MFKPLHNISIVVVGLHVSAGLVGADILNVPDDYSTIQAAIDAAQDGDEIVVAPGTYVELLDLKGKEITLRSSEGPDATLLMGFLGGTVIDVNSNALIQGFTIRSTDTYPGEGVFCGGTSPTIVECVFEGHSQGALVAGGAPVFLRCRFSGNDVAVDNVDGSMTLVNCVVIGNIDGVMHYGFITGGSSSVINTLIHGQSGRAALSGEFVTMGLYNCTVSNNGAGVDSYFGEIRARNSIFWDNAEYVFGGKAYTIIATYSCIQGGWSGEGNINTDPLLSDPEGPDGLFGTDDDNVRLTPGSPCLDAGNNETVPSDEFDLDQDGDVNEPISFDLDELGRFVDDALAPDTGNGTQPLIDMGCYEFQPDCNGNGISDSLDIAQGTSLDCLGNGIPDECEPDCNLNGVADACDLADGLSQDCDGNGVPDECEDCNGNGQADICDLNGGTSGDCNGDGRPDECNLADGESEDCNTNSIPDECETLPQQLGFSAPVLYPAGNGPWGVAAADFDNDGDVDIATANLYNNRVSVLLNDGDGVFEPIEPQEPVESALTAAAADFDGDGNQDLVVGFGEFQNAVLLLWGNGDGSFEAGESYLVGDDIWQVIVTDLNNDEAPDIGVAVVGDDQVAILINSGDGTFAPAVLYEPVGAPLSITSGDFDGDSDVDLASVDFNYPDPTLITLFLNTGDGSLVNGGSFAVSENARTVSAGNLNGDGTVDLAITHDGLNEVSIWLNDGNAAFTEFGAYATGEYPTLVIPNDLDGDFDLDLIIINQADTVATLWLNVGDGTFENRMNPDLGAVDFSKAAVVADFDGNGSPDIVVANVSTDNVSLLFNTRAEALGEDCNRNGMPDDCDIADGHSTDDDGNGVPDECDPATCVGDVNGDNAIDPLDAGYVLARLGCLVGAGDPDCDAADANSDNVVDPLDVGYVLSRFGECP